MSGIQAAAIGGGGLEGIGSIFGAIGLGQQAAGQRYGLEAQAGEALGQATISNYNAAVDIQNAQYIQQATVYKQQLTSQAGARQMSSMQAQAGASGLVPSTGAPLMAQAKQAAQNDLQNLMIGYQGQVGMQEQYNQAALDSTQAVISAQRAGNLNTAAGMVSSGAGSSLLSGFGSAGMSVASFFK